MPVEKVLSRLTSTDDVNYFLLTSLHDGGEGGFDLAVVSEGQAWVGSGKFENFERLLIMVRKSTCWSLRARLGPIRSVKNRSDLTSQLNILTKIIKIDVYVPYHIFPFILKVKKI